MSEFLKNLVALHPLLKERKGGDGSVGGKAGSAAQAIQKVTQCGGDAPALPVGVDIQPVQIAVPADVSKANDLVLLLSHQGVVAKEGAIPRGQIGVAICPGVQLLRGIVPDSMHRIIEKLCQRQTIRGAIFAQIQGEVLLSEREMAKRFPGARRSPRERFRAETVNLWQRGISP